MSHGLRWSEADLAAMRKRNAAPLVPNAIPKSTPSREGKYRNSPTTVDGERFDSKREAARHKQLLLLYRSGAISKPARQVRFPLPGGVRYVCDFMYLERGRGLVVEDAKGFRTKEYEIKKKLMREAWGIEVVET